jgi:micrococcal nuclease
MNDTNRTVRVRYIGIDTPEPFATKVPECGSEDATARNRELVSGQQVKIIPGMDPYDTHDRLLAYVYVGDIFVNQTLIAEGYATVMMLKPNTQYQAEFTNLYKKARQENRGIWAGCSNL